MRPLTLTAAVVLTVIAAHSAEARTTGQIVRFECGDNCWLTIREDSGRETTGLCVAPACRPWNEATEIPRRLIGRRIEAVMGREVQYDGGGTPMGRALSFRRLKILP